MMLRTLLITVLLVLAPPGPETVESSELVHIASFNIHYIVPNDENDDWQKRRQAVTGVLTDMDADIVAFQEMETFDGGHYSRRNLQLEWILATTTGYEVAASGDPAVFPGTQPIIYKADKYAVVDQGFFFFSDTPDKIYSEQWNGGYPYFCSWARFRATAARNDFYVFNVHNDFKSRGNRLKTSRLVADRIGRTVQEALPIIVLGDFNASRESEEIRIIEAIGLDAIAPNGATNRILGMHLLPAIDHILISRDFKPQSDIKVWRNRYDGVYPTDHYPISVKITFQAEGI